MKLVIDNRTGSPDSEALAMVQRVMHEGLISTSRDGPQYCYYTTFRTGHFVSARRTAKSHLFIVGKEAT